MIDLETVLDNINYLIILQQNLLLLFIFLICISMFYVKRVKKLWHKTDIINKMVSDFQPEPLVPPARDTDTKTKIEQKILIIEQKTGAKMHQNGKLCLNLISNNYLNLSSNPEIEARSIKAIEKYGVGSCGPRAFYGTVVVHLDLEEKIAKFMNSEEAILYSYGFSTISSTISAYCKQTDVIFCDDKICDAVRIGITASRSRCFFFKHNDPVDLEDKIINYEPLDPMQKKFLLLEGIYAKTGQICDLPSMIHIRKKYQLRLFLDETNSIGILGKTGKGVVEHFGINQIEVDLISGSLENLIGSVGGFSVGSHFIIEHQRLSALGYCFSAALPPVLTCSALFAFDMLEQNPMLFERIRCCSKKLHGVLRDIENMMVFGNEVSPIKYLEFSTCYNKIRKEHYTAFVEECLNGGVLVNVCSYSVSDNPVDSSIKICTNVTLSEEDLTIIYYVISTAASNIISKLYK